MSKKASVKHKRGWSDEYIQYGFEIFHDKDAQKVKGQCVICYKVLGNDSLRPSKLSNHLLKIHPEYKDKGIAFFERKRDGLKRAKLDSSGTFFKENISLVEASYEVALQIAKQKKPHTIAESLVKPCAIKMVERVLGKQSSKKLEALSLSDNTIQRRITEMADDISSQLISKLKSSLHGMFSIQLDESTDISNVSHLMVFVQWASNISIEEAILFCSPLESTTRAADILQKVDDYFKKWDLNWKNVCSVCTDGAPAMIGARSGFARRVKELAPGATSVHCMIHRQALASRTLPSDLQSALKIAIKTVNFVKKSALNTRLFSKLCKDMSADHTTLLYHTDVRWLSKGNMLSRVFELREELAEFLGRQKQELATYFGDPLFIQRLAYLADIFEKLNTLNLSMQGGKTNMINLYDSLNAFVDKLALWKMHVMKDVFVMFDRLSALTTANSSVIISAEVTEHLCKLDEELDYYFPECTDMNEKLKIVRNPINANFSFLPMHLQEELIDLKNDSTIKTAFENSELTTFWCNASASYPQVTKYIMSKLLPFGSTYLCEAAFSALVSLKTRARNAMSVENDLICALSCIEPRISLLAKNKQTQPSH